MWYLPFGCIGVSSYPNGLCCGCCCWLSAGLVIAPATPRLTTMIGIARRAILCMFPPLICRKSNLLRSMQRRKELLEFIHGRLTAVLSELERLGVLDSLPLFFPVERDQALTVLVGHREVSLFHQFEQIRLPFAVPLGNIWQRSALPRILVAKLRWHRAHAFPFLVGDLVDAHDDRRVERLRVLET